MNKTDPSNSASENNWGDWKSWTPEYFLSVLLYELRTPLTVIKGYVEILSNEKEKEHHSQALESISKTVVRMEKLQENIAEYLRDLKTKS